MEFRNIDRLLLLCTERSICGNTEVFKLLEDAAKSQDDAHAFIVNLLQMYGRVDSKEASVYKCMTLLESVAETHEHLACIFMSHLWMCASKIQMHDVCDSIKFWLSSCASYDVMQHLIQIANFHVDENVRRHFLETVATMRLATG